MPLRIENKEDWQPFEEEIIRLYAQQKWPLNKVKKFMLDNRDLLATTKQYKGLFSRHNIKKNIKGKDWVAIGVQHQQRDRDGKATQVCVRGAQLSSERVLRELNRYKGRIEKAAVEDSARLNQDVVLHTPPASPGNSFLVPWDPMNLDGSLVALNNHWETKSLDILSEAMSDVDWSDIAENPRKILLYHLPSSRLQRTLSLEALRLWDTTDEYAQRVPDYVIHQSIDHDWSWDQLRSVIPAWKIQLQPTVKQFDLALCSETELLGIVISTFSNEYTDWSSVLDGIMRWIVCRRHHALLLTPVQRTATSSTDESVLGFFLQLANYVMEFVFPSATIPLKRVDVGDLIPAFRTIMAAFSSASHVRLSLRHRQVALLRIAIKLKLPDEVKALLYAIADTKLGLWTLTHAFNSALESNDHHIINMLIQFGGKPKHPSQVIISRDNPKWAAEDLQLETPFTRDLDMGISQTDYDERRTMFTYAEFCLFRSPSLARLFKGKFTEWIDTQILRILVCLVEQRVMPSTTTLLAQELVLYAAVEFDNVNIARKLVDFGVNVDCPAAREFVADLMTAQGMLDERPLDPLEHALRNNSHTMTTLLLKAGAYARETVLTHGVNMAEPATWQFLQEIKPEMSCGSIDTWGLGLLFLAVRDGDRDAIIKLLHDGVNINGCTSGGGPPFTPLICALLYCRFAMVEFLWYHGAIFHQSGPRAGSAELSIVCYYITHGKDMLLKLRFLLAKKASPNEANSMELGRYDGRRPPRLPDHAKELDLAPLQWLFSSDVGHWLKPENMGVIQQAVEILLRNGADIDCGCSMGPTPLQQASAHEATAISKFLVAQGADINLTKGNVGIIDSSPLSNATWTCDLDLVRCFVEHGALINREDLATACRCGNLDIIRLVLACLAEINNAAVIIQYSLESACQCGRLDAVKVLMDHGGADANSPCNMGTLLLAASHSQKGAPIIEYLVDKGAIVNGGTGKNDEKPLHIAALFGHLEVAMALLERGADVDAVCRISPGGDMWKRWPLNEPGDFTAIEAAAVSGQLDMVKLLINAGAEQNVRQGKFARAIEIAERHGRMHVAELLRREASRNEWEADGNSPG